MILRLSLMILLANGVVMAQPLYKWKEADGTITFSPQPPAEGIRYDVLDSAKAMGTAAKGDAVVAGSGFSKAAAATLPDATPETATTFLPRVRHAPGTDNELPPALSRSSRQAIADPGLATTGTALVVDDNGRNGDTVQGSADTDIAASIGAASFKKRRCEDLRKRVTSLERRLRQPLTPEDMDNTIVHMARYQRSHDQYCVQ